MPTPFTLPRQRFPELKTAKAVWQLVRNRLASQPAKNAKPKYPPLKKNCQPVVQVDILPKVTHFQELPKKSGLEKQWGAMQHIFSQSISMRV